MDNDFAGGDMNELKSEDVEIKQRRFLKTSRRRFNIERGQLEILENAFKETSHIDTEKAVELSAFVGLPYYKIKKWFSNRRSRTRRLVETENTSDSSDGMDGYDSYRQGSTRIPACLPLKRLRNGNGISTHSPFQELQSLPVVSAFQSTTAKQTTQTQQTTSYQKSQLMQSLQQTTFGVKQQTITQQIHTQPLCWPPVYQANPSFNTHGQSMSRILVDYLKDNPHLLTPVQPTKRRRVECENNVPKCEDSIFDKVKRWFMTMETSAMGSPADDLEGNTLPETEILDLTSTPPSASKVLSSGQDISSRHTSQEDPCAEKEAHIVPDDVSVMLESYTKDTHSVLSEDRTSDVGSNTLSCISKVSDARDVDSSHYSEGRSDLSGPSLGFHVMENVWKAATKVDITNTCFEGKSSGLDQEKLVNLP